MEVLMENKSQIWKIQENKCPSLNLTWKIPMDRMSPKLLIPGWSWDSRGRHLFLFAVRKWSAEMRTGCCPQSIAFCCQVAVALLMVDATWYNELLSMGVIFHGLYNNDHIWGGSSCTYVDPCFNLDLARCSSPTARDFGTTSGLVAHWCPVLI